MASDVAPEIPSFSFLQDARPIFSDRNTLPEEPYPRAQPITAFVPQNNPTNAVPIGSDNDWLKQASPPSQPPATGLPSLPIRSEVSPVPAFSFLEELRPPVLVPSDNPRPSASGA